MSALEFDGRRNNKILFCVQKMEPFLAKNYVNIFSYCFLFHRRFISAKFILVFNNKITMVLDEIAERLAKRRNELREMLEHKSKGLALEKQHQIYGAINEIDLFLQTLNYYQQNPNDNDLSPLRLMKPNEEKTDNMFSRLLGNLKEETKTGKTKDITEL